MFGEISGSLGGLMGGCPVPGGHLRVHAGRQMEVPLLLACSCGYFLKLLLLCLNHVKLILSRGWPCFSGLTAHMLGCSWVRGPKARRSAMRRAAGPGRCRLRLLRGRKPPECPLHPLCFSHLKLSIQSHRMALGRPAARWRDAAPGSHIPRVHDQDCCLHIQL